MAMTTQSVRVKEPVFQGELAQGYVLGVKAVAPQYYRHHKLLEFVRRDWSKQKEAGLELEIACAHLGSAPTAIEPLDDGEDLALGFVLGVLVANSIKVVPFPDIVAHSQQFVRLTDQSIALEEAARTLSGLGLVSIESMSSPAVQWRLWRRDRQETV
jgi:hypothetical protein